MTDTTQYSLPGPFSGFSLTLGSGAGSSLWPAGLCGLAPSPLLYFPPLSLPCSFSPRPFLAQDVCTRSSSTWNAFSWPPFTWLVSLLWVSDDHPTMTSPPHLQTWLPPPASSPCPQCSPAPLDSFLGAHRYRLSPALACELREGSGFSPDIPSAQHRPGTDSVQGLLC